MESPKIEFYKLRDFGSKLSAVVDFLRENFKGLFICLLLIGGPAALLLSLVFRNLMSNAFQYGLESGQSGNGIGDMATFFAVMGGNYILVALASWLTISLIVCVTYTYIKLYNEGVAHEKSVGDIFRQSLSKYGGILALSVLIVVVSMVGFFVFIIPGIYLIIALSIAYPIYVFEEVSIGTAFSRAFTLIKGKWWSTFGVIFVTGIMASVAQMVFSVPLIVVYFIEIFSMVEDMQNNPGDPSAALNMFTSGYMAVALTIYMIGAYITRCIPLIGLGYQYSNLVERNEGRGLMGEIESFDSE